MIYDSFCFPTGFITPNSLVIEKSIKKSNIKSVMVNEKKRIITVVFDDNDVRMIKCSEEDTFDITIGVSLAISEHLFGSKTKRSKWLEKKVKKV